jgi:hypothetical protein
MHPEAFMKVKILLAVLLLWPVLAPGQGNIDFSAFFTGQTMRVDVFHTGAAKEEIFTIDRIIQEGPWAGNPLRLLTPFAFGRYLLRVNDMATGQAIYSKGFDSYFGEYKTTEPGGNGVKKTFSESLLIPYPRNKVRRNLFSAARSTRPTCSSSAKNRATTSRWSSR